MLRITTVLVLALAAGCSSSDPPAAEPSPERAAVEQTPDRCGEATDDAIASIDTLLDRFDSNPDGAMQDGDAIREVFREIGETVGEGCGADASGGAFSELVTYVADEAATRESRVTAEAAEGLLGGMCSSRGGLEASGVELTTQARVACSGTETENGS